MHMHGYSSTLTLSRAFARVPPFSFSGAESHAHASSWLKNTQTDGAHACCTSFTRVRVRVRSAARRTRGTAFARHDALCICAHVARKRRALQYDGTSPTTTHNGRACVRLMPSLFPMPFDCHQKGVPSLPYTITREYTHSLLISQGNTLSPF